MGTVELSQGSNCCQQSALSFFQLVSIKMHNLYCVSREISNRFYCNNTIYIYIPQMFTLYYFGSRMYLHCVITIKKYISTREYPPTTFVNKFLFKFL